MLNAQSGDGKTSGSETREPTPLNMSFGLGYEIKLNVCSGIR